MMKAVIIYFPFGVVAFDEKNNLAEKMLFPKKPQAAAKSIMKIEAGKISEIKSILIRLKNIGYDTFAFENASAASEAKKELGIETVHRAIDRSELYTADECFLTGTAAHVTPVAEIDHRKIGDGEIGNITGKLQEIYAKVITGDHPNYQHWCTPVFGK